MRYALLTVLSSLLAMPVLASDSDNAIGNETVTADQAQDKAETDTADEAKAVQPFKVPLGFRQKTKGKRVVYCKKETEPGTRFSNERCYDETQLRAMEAARQQEQAAIEQSRKICSNQEACGGG